MNGDGRGRQGRGDGFQRPMPFEDPNDPDQVPEGMEQHGGPPGQPQGAQPPHVGASRYHQAGVPMPPPPPPPWVGKKLKMPHRFASWARHRSRQRHKGWRAKARAHGWSKED